MIGFRSPPFLLFFPPLPFAALFAAVTACFALLMAAFLMSLPFIICRWGSRGSAEAIEEETDYIALIESKAIVMNTHQQESRNVNLL